MEAFEFLFDFFTDINVYIAGALVYLFGPKFKQFAKWAWGRTFG